MDGQPEKTTVKGKKMERINKNTSVSIGLGVTLASALLWGGITLGRIQEKLTQQKEVIETFVPRKELEIRMKDIYDELTEINGTLQLQIETQNQILFKLN